MSVSLFALASSTTLDELENKSLSLVEKFAIYKQHFGKTYTHNEATAFEAFSENDKIIRGHNAGNFSWTLGHNEFSDMTWEQFKDIYVGGYHAGSNRTKNYDYSLLEVTDLEDSVDWVSKGAVTPVKNQGQCGSCWGFSAIGSIEGAYQISGSSLTQFSEQQLVSCDNSAHGGQDQGCNGGLMDNAFTWIESNGICLESDYPYTSGSGDSGTCQSTCKSVATLTGFSDVPGEDGLKAAISVGPVSIAVEADKSAFQLYKSGVLDDSSCGTNVDHGVLIVGYGTDSSAGKDYYKIKNSWGANWGENGYLRVVQGKNMCGLSAACSYPTGVKPIGPAPTPPPPTPPPAPPTPPPSPSSSNECNPAKTCNVCTACCQTYIPDGASCDACVANKCPHNECNPAKTCNVCTACCQAYIPDGAACDSCVNQKC